MGVRLGSGIAWLELFTVWIPLRVYWAEVLRRQSTINGCSGFALCGSCVVAGPRGLHDACASQYDMPFLPADFPPMLCPLQNWKGKLSEAQKAGDALAAAEAADMVVLYDSLQVGRAACWPCPPGACKTRLLLLFQAWATARGRPPGEVKQRVDRGCPG